jgi:predicted nucleic acid-binding Zn ribbon protein
MEIMVNSKCCPICGKHIVGRTDKKFCSDKCRSKFHYGNSKQKATKLSFKRIKGALKMCNIKLTYLMLSVSKKCLLLKINK